MSYVIQNFSQSNKKIILNPRFKFIFILLNLNKFFIFIKLNTFLNLTSKINYFHLSHLTLFFKYFFSKQYLKFIYKNNLNYLGNYTNNISKSCIFYFFYNFYNFLINKKIIKNHFYLNEVNIYNSYLMPLHVLNIQLNNTFYKNLFYFFMFVNQFIWYQHDSKINFYLNFLFINYNLKISRFYNGHFMKIYNY